MGVFNKKLKIGDKVNMLTVLGYCGYDKNGFLLYKWKCECGNVILKKNTVNRKSCGCIRQTIKIGQQHGNAKIINLIQAGTKDNGYKWLWELQCNCGTRYTTTNKIIKMGKRKNCGCKNSNLKPIKVEKGMRFGTLIVLEDLGKSQKVKCECGTIKNCKKTDLTS